MVPFLSACPTKILHALIFFPVRVTWLAHLIFFLSNHPKKWQNYAIHSTDTKEGVHIQHRTAAYEHKVKARSGREKSNYGKGSVEINWANKTSSSQKVHRPAVFVVINTSIQESVTAKYVLLVPWNINIWTNENALLEDKPMPAEIMLKTECPVVYWKQSAL